MVKAAPPLSHGVGARAGNTVGAKAGDTVCVIAGDTVCPIAGDTVCAVADDTTSSDRIMLHVISVKLRSRVVCHGGTACFDWCEV